MPGAFAGFTNARITAQFKLCSLVRIGDRSVRFLAQTTLEHGVKLGSASLRFSHGPTCFLQITEAT